MMFKRINLDLAARVLLALRAALVLRTAQTLLLLPSCGLKCGHILQNDCE
jgi:hypothetical protein